VWVLCIIQLWTDFDNILEEEARPRNDLYCVRWDVKPYSLTHWERMFTQSGQIFSFFREFAFFLQILDYFLDIISTIIYSRLSVLAFISSESQLLYLHLFGCLLQTTQSSDSRAAIGCIGLSGGSEVYQFEESRLRNMSSPVFSVTAQSASSPQQQELPGDRALERTSEVEDIPQQLTVQPPQHLLNYQRWAILHHLDGFSLRFWHSVISHLT